MEKFNFERARGSVGIEREDYLQAIFLLEKEYGEARISDIARALDIKKPSVTQMMSRLEDQEFLKHERYGGVRLTRKGRLTAVQTLKRREALIEFMNAIGVSKKHQTKDVHGIEHHISPVTLKKLRAATKTLQELGKN